MPEKFKLGHYPWEGAAQAGHTVAPLLSQSASSVTLNAVPGNVESLKNGERGRIRTCDPCLKRALLYQLSYAPTVQQTKRIQIA